MRMPFPPPPAEALIKIGKPIDSAVFFASAMSVIASSVPGTKGVLYFDTASLAASLLPMTSMASADGPIKVMPASSTWFANSAFSLKKPKPG